MKPEEKRASGGTPLVFGSFSHRGRGAARVGLVGDGAGAAAHFLFLLASEENS